MSIKSADWEPSLWQLLIVLALIPFWLICLALEYGAWVLFQVEPQYLERGAGARESK
jgi:hypothetical protein